MEQVIFGGSNAELGDTSTRYNTLLSAYTWTTLASGRRGVISTSGKIKNLRVKLDGSPGAGKSYAFTVMLNGSPTALTFSIADTATSGSNTVNEVDVVAGDWVSLRCVPTSTPTVRAATWTSMFKGATAKESLIQGNNDANVLSNVDIRYLQVMCADTAPTAVEDDKRQVCPTSGKIKNLYVILNLDPGTAPDAYRFTLRKNGISQTLTVTITADDTTGNDTVNEITVAAGDVLTMMVEPIDSPSVSPRAYWGMTFVADTDGESIILSGASDDLNPSTAEYITLLTSRFNDWSATESERYQLGQVCTLKKLYVLLSTAPGSGKSYTFTARIAGASNVVAVVANTDTTGDSSALEDTVVDDDLVSLECVPASTPTVADAYWGLVSYIEPLAVVPGSSPLAQMIQAGLV